MLILVNNFSNSKRCDREKINEENITEELNYQESALHSCYQLESKPSCDEPAIDFTQTELFLNMLAGKPDSEFQFQTFDDNPIKKRPELVRSLYGKFSEHRDHLATLNSQGASVSVCINETDGSGARQIKNIIKVRALFADCDGVDPKPILDTGFTPHIIVESSPNKWHLYWLVSDCSLEQFKPLQKAIATKFGADNAVCDLPRVMRLPGFIHRKGRPVLTHLIEVNG